MNRSIFKEYISTAQVITFNVKKKNNSEFYTNTLNMKTNYFRTDQQNI